MEELEGGRPQQSVVQPRMHTHTHTLRYTRQHLSQPRGLHPLPPHYSLDQAQTSQHDLQAPLMSCLPAPSPTALHLTLARLSHLPLPPLTAWRLEVHLECVRPEDAWVRAPATGGPQEPRSLAKGSPPHRGSNDTQPVTHHRTGAEACAAEPSLAGSRPRADPGPSSELGGWRLALDCAQGPETMTS